MPCIKCTLDVLADLKKKKNTRKEQDVTFPLAETLTLTKKKNNFKTVRLVSKCAGYNS